MSTRGRRLLWIIVGAGVVGRVVLAFTTVGTAFDIDGFRQLAEALEEDLLHTYSTLGTIQLGGFSVARFPYPSGSFPWAAASLELEKATGLPLHGTVQLAPIAADAAIAWLVQHYLGLRGASERTRLGAAALVAMGPCFWMISGYHGQIDALAIAPAVAALVVWEQASPSRRGLYAGLLIGLGGTIKTVPLFMLLPLLPSVRSRREAATLVGATAGIFLIAMAPWLLSEFHAVKRALGYSGGPGLGGVTVLLQPDLVRALLTEDYDGFAVSSLVRDLHAQADIIVPLMLAGVAIVLFRFRPPPVQGAVLLWLAFYALAPAFFFQYLIWGLPFFIMAGHLREVALLQAWVFPAMVIFYLRPWANGDIAYVYLPVMGAVWVAFVLALFLQGKLIVTCARGAPRAGPTSRHVPSA